MRTVLSLLLAAAAPALAAAPAANELPPPPPPPSVSLDAAPGVPETQARKVRLYMTDGQELTCVLLGETKDKLRVRIGSGAPFDVARSSIRDVEDADAVPSPENYFRDPNVTRTFYAPTGFRLRQGEAYFSQKELLFSSFGYGINDNLSVMVGSILPIWFTSGGQNIIGGFKIGMDVSEVWHVAAGAQGFAFPNMFGSGSGPGGFGFVFGTATCGTPLLNITLSVGEGLGTFASQGTFIAVGSASWRVAEYVALETENWFIPSISGVGGEPFLILNSAGVRLMNKNLAADIGFVRIPGSPVPWPWLDFTYTFST